MSDAQLMQSIAANIVASDAIVINQDTNQPPAAQDDAVSTAEDVPLTFDVRANDSDPENGPLTVTDFTQPAHGTLTLDPQSGAFTYTPDADFSGADSFSYTLTDENGDTDTAQVALTVTPVNDAPQISGPANGAVTIDENARAVTQISATDTEGDTVTFAIAGGEDAALFEIDPTTGALAFISAPDFETPLDSDSDNTYAVSIAASDGTDTTQSDINVSVADVFENQPPAAQDDAVSTAEDVPLTFDVRANDSDPENGPLTVTDFTQPAHGTLTLDPQSGAFTYTPDADFSGADSFSYTLTDENGDTDTAQVALTVTPVNDAPQISGPANGAVTIDENARAVTQISATDTEGDTVTFAIAGGEDAALFEIDPTTGALAFISAPDFETPLDSDSDNTYAVSIAASDGTDTTQSDINVSVADRPTMQFVVSSGQSLSVGTTIVQNVLTDAPVYADRLLALDFGTHNFVNKGWQRVPVDEGQFQGFRPLQEFNTETHVSAMMNQMVHSLDAIGMSDTIFTHINVGTGGSSIAELMVSSDDIFDDVDTGLANTSHGDLFAVLEAGQPYKYYVNGDDITSPKVVSNNIPASFDNLTIQLQLAHDKALLEGYEVDTQIVTNWIQGQSDPGIGGKAFGYEHLLNRFFDKVEQEANSIFDEDTSILGLVSQHRGYGTKAVAIDQIEVVRTNPNIYFGAPEYQFEARYPSSIGLDYTHLSAEGYHMFGQLMGRKLADALAGTPDAPILISDVTATTNTELLVQFEGLTGQLVDDQSVYTSGTGLLPIENLGFFVYTEDGFWSPTRNLPEVTSAQIAGPDTVALSFSRPVEGNFRLYLGRNNDDPSAPDNPTNLSGFGGTSLRDSHITTALETTSGQTLQDRNIYEYAPIQYVDLTFDFGGAPAIENAGAVSVDENETIVIDFETTDEDGEGSGLSYTLVGGVDAALFELDALTGELTFLTPANFEQPFDADSDNIYHVTVSVTDSDVLTHTTDLHIDVRDVSENPPAAEDIEISSDEDNPISGTLTASDPDGDDLVFALVSGPQNGMVDLNGNGDFTYTPLTNFNGTDSFTYSVEDETGFSDTATVSVVAFPVNDAPVATDTSVQTNEDQPVSGAITATDVEGDILSFALGTAAQDGTVALQDGGAFTYTPNANFFGTDRFTILVDDGDGGSAVGTVSIEITSQNDVPIIQSEDTFTVAENLITGPAIIATDADGDNISYAIEGGDDAQLLSIDQLSGNLVFVTAPDFELPSDADSDGSYQVTISASDEVSTSTQEITITVEDVYENTPPELSVVSQISVLENSDAVLTISVQDDVSGLGDGIVFSLSGDDAAQFEVEQETGAISFTLPPDFETPDDLNADNVYALTIIASDIGGLSDSASLEITVTDVFENVDPNTFADQYDVAFNLPLTVDAMNGVLANDTDDDGDPLTSTISTDPENGLATLNLDGSFTYTPDAGYSGADSFTYTASDGRGGSTIETVTLDVAQNSIPVARDDTFSTDEDTPIIIDVLANDEDPDGSSLSLTPSSVSSGLLEQNADNTLTYAPAANANGAVSFTYTITDPEGNSDTAGVTIDIASVNDAPVPDALDVTVDEDGVFNGQLTATDIDSSELTFALDAQATNGSVTINPNGSFQYTPNANDNGPDSFTFSIDDGDGAVVTSSATITINSVNDAPVFTSANTFDADENQLIAANLSALDVDGDTLSYAITGGNDAPAFDIDLQTGVLSFVSSPDFEQPIDHDASNDYSLQVTVSDGTLSAVQDVVVNVIDVYENVPPELLNAENLIIIENSSVIVDLNATDDVDAEPDGLVYSVSGSDADRVTIDATTGALSFASPPDFEAPDDADLNGVYDLTVTVTDSGTLFDQSDIQITIANETEPTDVPVPSAYDNVFIGDQNNNPIAGTSLNDWIEGGDGRDNIFGGAGDDYIIPGAGQDWYVRGGSGADIFQYGLADQDVSIFDFEDGIDKIRLMDGLTLDDLIFRENVFNGITTLSLNTSEGGRFMMRNVTAAMIDEDDILQVAGSVNASPQASDGVFSVDEDAALSDVLSGFDPDGDPIGFALGSAPANGVATVNSNGTFTYTPTANFYGSDAFSFILTDNRGGSDTAEVVINIAALPDAPVAQDGQATTLSNAVVSGQLQSSDPDGDIPTYSLDTDPANGAVSINSDGLYVYTPDDGFFGLDQFTYLVDDGTGNTDTATIIIDVKQSAAVPVPSAYDNVFIGDQNNNPIAGTSLNDWIEGGDGRDNIFGGAGDDYIIPGAGQDWYVRGGSGADIFQYGLADQDVSIFDFEDGIDKIRLMDGLTLDDLIFRENVFNGITTLSLNTSEGGRFMMRNVTAAMIDEDDILQVAGSPNTSPVAEDAQFDGDEDTALSGSLIATDPEDDPITFSLGSSPENGTLEINPDGSFTYTPQAHFHGADEFTFIAADDRGGLDVGDVSINIAPQPDSPVAEPASISTLVDRSVSGQLISSDPDGDIPVYLVSSDPGFGLVSITFDGAFTYTPFEGYAGPDQFSYLVDDGTGNTDTAIVTIDVVQTSDEPSPSNYDNVLIGDANDNPIVGTSANDWIEGREGRDNLFGGAGDDYIYAGPGNDWYVRGGSGADIFQFGLNDGDLTIHDFEDGSDLVRLMDGLTLDDMTMSLNTYNGVTSVIYRTLGGDRLILNGTPPELFDDADVFV